MQSAAFPPSDRVSGVNSSIQMAYALNVEAGITQITVTLSVAKGAGISVTEWSNIVASNPADGSNFGGGVTPATGDPSPNITPVGTNDLVVGAVCGVTSTITLDQVGSNPNSGWNALTGLNPASGTTFGAVAYQILSAAANLHTAWTWLTSAAVGLITAAFKSTGVPALLHQTEQNFPSQTVDVITIPATAAGSMLMVVVAQNAATTAGLLTITDNAPATTQAPASSPAVAATSA